MTAAVPSAPGWPAVWWIVLLDAAGAFALAMGTRQTMGLFIGPINSAAYRKFQGSSSIRTATVDRPFCGRGWPAVGPYSACRIRGRRCAYSNATGRAPAHCAPARAASISRRVKYSPDLWDRMASFTAGSGDEKRTAREF